MKEFKFLTKNKGIDQDEDMYIIDIGPIFNHPTTSEPIRGITYGDVYGNRKYTIIDEGHPLWSS